MNIKVVSKRSLSPELGWSDIYVGRPSPLGNPFQMNTEAERDSVVAQYRKWLWAQIQDGSASAGYELIAIARRVKKGEQIRLVCFCAPRKCHADIIVNAINWLIESGRV